MRGLLPLMLIGLGIYILQAYVFKNNANSAKNKNFSTYADSKSFISNVDRVDFQDNDFVSQSDFSGSSNPRRWKNH
jgi:hypothetical protein